MWQRKECSAARVPPISSTPCLTAVISKLDKILFSSDMHYVLRSLISCTNATMSGSQTTRGIMQQHSSQWWESYMVMQRRGVSLEMLNTLYDADVFFWSKVKAHHTDREPYNVPCTVICSNASHGGFGAPRPGTVVVNNSNVPAIPKLKHHENRDEIRYNFFLISDDRRQKNWRAILWWSVGRFTWKRPHFSIQQRYRSKRAHSQKMYEKALK